MDDTNLSGLDLSAAREYILAFATEAKRLEKDLAAAEAELGLWRGRVTLAEGKAMADLAAAARAKADEIAAKVASLSAERADIKSKVEAMRLQLPGIRARERSIDPDRLLAELQLMTGELLGDEAAAEDGRPSQAAVSAEFAKLEAGAKADADLEALKRKMEGAPPAGDGSGGAPPGGAPPPRGGEGSGSA